jgi:hypothetical protein
VNQVQHRRHEFAGGYFDGALIKTIHDKGLSAIEQVRRCTKGMDVNRRPNLTAGRIGVRGASLNCCLSYVSYVSDGGCGSMLL